MRDYVSVVSGLRIPEDDSPAGFNYFHGGIHSASLTGMHNGHVPNGADSDSYVIGTSSDQIVADALFASTPRKYKHLPLRVQVSANLGPYRCNDSLAFRMDAGATEARKLGAESSPRAAYTSLFTNFSTGTDPTVEKAAELALRKRKSVLDFVKDNTQRLAKRLGSLDKARLDRHFTEIRDLEMQLDSIPPPMPNNSCNKLDAFGDDPPQGGGYSNEELRAKLMCDVMHMALTCDQTRVGSLMFTMVQSFMSAQSTLGFSCTHHDLGHFGAGGDNSHKLALGIAWHMKHFGYFLSKLANTPDHGGMLLDNCAIAFVFEGGHGPSKGVPSKLTTHSGENMVVLVAGKAGGLQSGQHLVANGKHPASVLISCMNAVGVTTDKLGAVSGEIPGLRS
jgi:Protein of unknown function (DUF1552)